MVALSTGARSVTDMFSGSPSANGVTELVWIGADEFSLSTDGTKQLAIINIKTAKPMYAFLLFISANHSFAYL
jgi:hypothetical protein